jgi:ribosome biogenesis GTPase
VGDDAAALVIAGHGRQFVVRLPDGRDTLAVTRGRRSDVCVGDRVTVDEPMPGQTIIETVHPRRNTLMRSDARYAKRLATNVDRIGIVVAPWPPYSEDLLLRVLIAAETAGIEAMIIANKSDLPARATIEPRLAACEAVGYPVLRISAQGEQQRTSATLAPWLAGGTTLLLGQSGMGKSTLVNSLVPTASLATAVVSEAMSSGRHTTTFSRLFDLPDIEGRIIDSPGFQTFGLAHLSPSQRVHGMREFVPRLGRCRFHNCIHREEPGCEIRRAVMGGEIDARRYELYVSIAEAEAQR